MHIDTEPDAVRPQAVLRDLVAVSALSAAWIGKEPPAIATALADALVDLLQLDFAFVHLSNRGGTEAVDATRGNALPRLSDWLASHGSPANPLRPAEIIPDVGGDSGPCLVVPVGFDGDAGVVAAACGRDGFPTAIDELLISLAANHAAVAFQSARLIEERQRAEGALRQARDDLELKVAERTAQLGQLAGEQAALQHVAVLVAQQPSPDEVFTAVTEAVGPLLGADLAAMHVFPGDGTATVVACWSAAGPKLPVGTRLPLDGDSTAARIFRTSAPARLDSYAGVGGDTADVARGLRLRSTVGAPIVVDGKLWGALMAAVRGDDPLPGDAETRIAAFTELVATAISNAQARRDMHWLADGQAALRRVATLVAEGAPQEQVFACVAREAAHVLQAPVVTIDRYDSDSFSTVVASLGEPDFPVGSRWPLDGPTLGATVFSTGQPARVDDYADLESTAAAVMRASSMRSAVGVPILVDGRPWGVICVGARDPTLLGDDFEARLVDFTKLLAAAIVRAESREALARVADEQAALRRMATLVARGAPADDVFSAVVREVGGLLTVGTAAMGRLEPDGMCTTVAAWSAADIAFPTGRTWDPEGNNVTGLVLRTGRPARLDDFSDASGPIGVHARKSGYTSAVGSPITVQGRLWGVITTASTGDEPLPPQIEDRLANFTELVATAISNADSREAVARLADSQAALRRVATLVAQGVPPTEIFTAVSEEVAGLFGAGACAGVLRFENDGPAVVFVGVAEVDIPIGTRWEFRAGTPSAEVYRTGRSARVDAMDWSSEEGPVAEAARSLDVVSTVASPIVVEGRLWGAMSVSSSERLMPLDAEGRLGEFTEIVATAIANAESRKALAHLVDQQAALRRVATLVARGVRPVEMFSAVTEAVSRVIGVPAVSVVRYEADGTATELANYFSRGRLFPVGVPMNIDGTNILRLVRESGAAARIDDYSQTKGEMAEIVRRAGVQSTVGVPVVVAGRVWGTVVGSTTEPGPLPADTELRLADFTELLATALGNAESREALEQLFEEQAALRRVATLVAEGVRPGEIFSAVSEEISRLFDTDSAAVVRFDHDGQAITFVGLASSLSLETIVGARWELNDSMATAQVYRTGRSARLDGMDWSTVDGPVGEVGRSLGITSTVASPIVVEGRLWGAMHVAAKRTLSLSTEAHLVAFTELVATAIANADSKSELAASRRRIVTASDETRRRIERDLHDGAQQRLVSVALALRETGLDVPSGLHPLHERIGRAADEVDGVIDDLRELAQGIHPAILLERGLGPALRTLALRASVPVELDIGPQQRFPKPIEVGAYYVVSEALTNAAKHAHASHARVTLEQENGYVRLSINDDGIGGADATRGSGLLGLRDRVEALGGSLEVESAAGKGTSLVVTLPLDASTETTGLKV